MDAYLSGHVHAFERSLPVLDNVPRFDKSGGIGGDGGEDAAGRSSVSDAGSSSKMVYEDPVAPVHIVNGAGGCLEVSANPEYDHFAWYTRAAAAAVNSINSSSSGGGSSSSSTSSTSSGNGGVEAL